MLSMSVPGALWLVDYGFRMPGVVSGPSPSAAVSPEDEQALWAERVATLTDDPIESTLERPEGVYHLVQDRPVIEKILEEELPPDEYYEALGRWLVANFLKADPSLLEHFVPLVAASDTATAFALSFGIAKFQLAQDKVKLVGEIVGREGRSPNPAIVRAIEKWPPVNTLKDLQAFLGTANYVRAHAGPAYSRVADPLRDFLRPMARFPPNEIQLKAIEEIKKLVLEDHVLAVPDELAAITAANRWLQGEAPGGRPYEMEELLASL